MTRAEIAAGLGIDPALVTRYRARGMPMESVAAAAAWKRANVTARATPSKPGAGWRVRLTALLPRAMTALAAGRFGDVEEELRSALRAVPESHAEQVAMPMAVWDALTDDVHSRICSAAATESGTAAPITKDEARAMGRFWMDVARGLVGGAAGE